MSERPPWKVMFLCTGNSCRSQMAEGFARELGKGLVVPFSAGLTPCRVHPLAIKVMHEVGIDISGQKSKAIDFRLLETMDFVITLCSHADVHCPSVPTGAKRVHMPVHDPVGTVGTEQEVLRAFRVARDEIGDKIQALLEDIRKIALLSNMGRGN